MNKKIVSVLLAAAMTTAFGSAFGLVADAIKLAPSNRMVNRVLLIMCLLLLSETTRWISQLS